MPKKKSNLSNWRQNKITQNCKETEQEKNRAEQETGDSEPSTSSSTPTIPSQEKSRLSYAHEQCVKHMLKSWVSFCFLTLN